MGILLGLKISAGETLPSYKEVLGATPRLTDRLSAPKALIVEGNPRPLIVPTNVGSKKVSEDTLRLVIAGGNPPALGSRPMQVDQNAYPLFALSQKANKVHRGKRPRYLEACSNELTKKTYITTQGVLSSHNHTRTHVPKHQVSA